MCIRDSSNICKLEKGNDSTVFENLWKISYTNGCFLVFHVLKIQTKNLVIIYYITHYNKEVVRRNRIFCMLFFCFKQSFPSPTYRFNCIKSYVFNFLYKGLKMSSSVLMIISLYKFVKWLLRWLNYYDKFCKTYLMLPLRANLCTIQCRKYIYKFKKLWMWFY